MIYKNTFWLNALSAIGLLVLFISFAFNKLYVEVGTAEEILFLIVAVHAFLVAMFALTAYVLGTNNKSRLNLLAEAFNYFCLILVIFPFIYLYNFCCSPPKVPYPTAYPFLAITASIAIVLFVVPTILNIKVLAALKR